MTRFDDQMQRPSPRRLYRDKKGGILFGVFAGIADYFGFKKGATQLVGFFLLMFFSPLILLYIILGLILPTKPNNNELYRSPEIEVLWRSYRKSPVGTMDELKHRFRSIDARLQKMERHVTSKRYQLESDFESLK